VLLIFSIIDCKFIGGAFFLSAVLLVAFYALVVGAGFLEAAFAFIFVAIVML